MNSTTSNLLNPPASASGKCPEAVEQPVATGIPGVVKLPAHAVRTQRRIAFVVVFLPIVALFVATWQVLTGRVGVMEWTILGVMYVICIIGSTVGLHRHFAHRAFKTFVPMRIGLGILGSMAAQGPLVYWVSSHRRHHAFSDQPGDPHSPNMHGGGLTGLVHGLWHAHIGWMFSDEQSDWLHFSRDIMQDRRLFRWVHQRYFTWVYLGLIIPFLAGWAWSGTLLGGLNGLLWGGLVRMFFVNHASWCVGSVCHVFGTKPFVTRDHSANNYFVALFTFGEGLQNNHHAFPSSAGHAVAWWQPDIALCIIRIMEFFGLAWDVKFPSHAAIEAARKEFHPPALD